MRKIEQNMLNAIRACRSWRQDNTAVSVAPDGAGLVTLHGHPIAQFDTDGAVTAIKSTFRKWPTATTRSRLRALGIDASLSHGRPCIDDREI